MSIVIGIDLGTSTTEAAIYRNGEKEMIPNEDGKIVIPSAIGIDEDGNWVIGERARAQLLLRPENTVIEVKRKTGSGELIALGNSKYRPVNLQAKLLSYVKEYASAYLGEPVDHAVISVPSYFNDIQRRETMEAGDIAGFTVDRILNEPTAAALSYGLDHMEEASHVLVYDLGGGTFDVTLLEMFDGVLEVKASSGDNQLGGKDFDEALINYLYDCFEKKTGHNIRGDRYAAVMLKDEAETCKMTLSDETSYHVIIPAITTINGVPTELDEIVTREKFEELTRSLLDRTHHPIDVVLGDAGIEERDIDQIILVGGSTRMPMVTVDIENYLGKAPVGAVNPDYAVSEGAAIQAGIISGAIDSADGLVMTDVNPYTLGIRVTDGMYNHDLLSIVIPRNVTIPVTRSETYYTAHDYQTQAQIEVYQGESPVASQNHFLGEFLIGDIPAKPAQQETIEVEFSYDLNGLLVVTATLSTGKSATIQINMTNTTETVDLSTWKDAECARAYRSAIRAGERMLTNFADDLSLETRDALQNALDDLKRAIIAENIDEADSLEERVAEIIRMANEEI